MRNTVYKKFCLTAIGAACSFGVLVAPSVHAGPITAFEARSLTLHALVHAFPRKIVRHRRGVAMRSVAYHKGKANHHGAVVRSATFHNKTVGLRKAAARKSLGAHRVVARKAVHRVLHRSSKT